MQIERPRKLTMNILVILLTLGFSDCFGSRGDFWYTPMKPPTPTEGVPWPLPQVLSFGFSNLTLEPSTLAITTNSRCDIVSEAIKRLRKVLITEKGKPTAADQRGHSSGIQNAAYLTRLEVTVEDASAYVGYPYLGMNENYSLVVFPNGTAYLRAPAVWGALRGLETFSQLTFEKMTSNRKAMKVRTCLIEDWPRFPHRGLLLDTSRHYLTLSMIKKNLNLMAHAKYNVFHWHIVDDQSFPYVSRQYPNLSAKGSYSPQHVYTKEMISEIVEYSRLLGIRVIAEFDTPGHTLAWGEGQSDLLTRCYSQGKYSSDYGVVDPSANSTYKFMLNLFTEVLKDFPDQYIHLGGDEVFFDCWESNMNVEQLMQQLGITPANVTKLEAYYIQKLMNIVQRARSNVSYIVWQDVVDNGVQVKPDTVIQVWRGNSQAEIDDEMTRITEMNLRTILSTCWYLDYIAYGNNWEDYYTCEPHHFPGTAHQKSLVIGGETCMWAEWVDGTNLIPRLWPRASVVAERLWSHESINNVAKAAARLEEHRCRLLRRGYQASSVNGPGHCSVEWNA